MAKVIYFCHLPYTAGRLLIPLIAMHQFFWITINDGSYVREKFRGLQQTTKIFPTNFINLSKAKLVKAKPQKFSLHYDKMQ